VYVPEELLHNRLDLSEPPIGRLLGDKEQEMPLADAGAVRLTVAEKPYRRWRVMVEFPDAFPAILTLVGSALREKSGTCAFPQTLLSTMAISKSNLTVPGMMVLRETLTSIRKPVDWSNANPRDSKNGTPR
jgi:hypothetical protein